MEFIANPALFYKTFVKDGSKKRILLCVGDEAKEIKEKGLDEIEVVPAIREGFVADKSAFKAIIARDKIISESILVFIR